jgi:hypothetical protein
MIASDNGPDEHSLHKEEGVNVKQLMYVFKDVYM